MGPEPLLGSKKPAKEMAVKLLDDEEVERLLAAKDDDEEEEGEP